MGSLLALGLALSSPQTGIGRYFQPPVGVSKLPRWKWAEGARVQPSLNIQGDTAHEGIAKEAQVQDQASVGVAKLPKLKRVEDAQVQSPLDIRDDTTQGEIAEEPRDQAPTSVRHLPRLKDRRRREGSVTGAEDQGDQSLTVEERQPQLDDQGNFPRKRQ